MASKRTRLRTAADIAKGRILDSRGNPFEYPKQNAAIHDAAYPLRYKPRLTVHTNQYAQDFRFNVSGNDRRMLLSRARELTSNVPSINAGILELADMTIGDAWRAKFVGKDLTWGVNAQNWLNRWMRICVYNDNISFQKFLKLCVISTLRDGDILTVLTGTDKTNYPQLQLIPSHLIGGGEFFTNGKVKFGKYAGYDLIDGCIIDSNNKVVAYNIMGPARDGSKDTQVSTMDSQLIYSKEYAEADRGITALAGACGNIEDYNTIKNWELIALRNSSRFALSMTAPKRLEGDFAGSEYEESPDVLFVNSTTEPTTKRKNVVENLQGGEIFLVNQEEGGKLDFLQPNRPGTNVTQFLMNLVMREAFYCLRIPPEFSYAIDNGGSTNKMLAIKVQWRIEQLQQEVVLPIWRRVVGYAIGKAMKYGFLPFNKEFDQFEPTFPRSFSSETSKDVKSDLELYNKGVITGTQMAESLGYDYIQTAQEKINELADIKTRAEKAGFTLEQIVMQQSVNGSIVTGDKNSNNGNDQNSNNGGQQ